MDRKLHIILSFLTTIEGIRFTEVRQPFGPRMCEVLCDSHTDCQSPGFNTQHLTCYVENDSVPKSLFQDHIRPNNSWLLGISPCQKMSRAILTRIHGQKCITVDPPTYSTNLTTRPFAALTSQQTTTQPSTFTGHLIKHTRTPVTNKQTTSQPSTSTWHPTTRPLTTVTTQQRTLQAPTFTRIPTTHTMTTVVSQKKTTTERQRVAVKKERKSKDLVILNHKQLLVFDVFTYTLKLRKRKPKHINDLCYNEHNHRLYWLSRKQPPSVGYFTGPAYDLETILVLKTGHIQNFGFDAKSLYLTYKKDTILYLYKARNGVVIRKFQRITSLPELYGPMIVNANMRTIYVYEIKTKTLNEITLHGKRKRCIKTTDKFCPLVSSDNSDIIYLPFRSGKIGRVILETWDYGHIKTSHPSDLKLIAVRHDKIVLLGKSEMYAFNRKWTLDMRMPLRKDFILMAAVITAR